MKEEAIFAAGCFWGVEERFRRMPGVLVSESGYTGGCRENPTYEQVCGGATGHAEAVRVVYDPSQISYEALVREFFALHDPTQLNRQGPDVGSQYRSAIFYTSDEQKMIAEKVRDEIAPHFFPKTIATEITQATTFWRAEDYHQGYAQRNPGVCHI